MSLLFNTQSRFVIAFLSRSKCLIISWLQSPSAVIFEAQENKIFHCFCFSPFYLPWNYVSSWSLENYFFFSLVLPLLDWHMHVCMLSCFSHVWLFVTLWTLAHQSLLSMGFPRQECWSGLPCLPPVAWRWFSWPRNRTSIPCGSCPAGFFTTHPLGKLRSHRSEFIS